MPDQCQIKLCGLKTPDAVTAGVDAGADYIGFVFYARSPRAVTPMRAAELARLIPGSVRIVALFVDPDDTLLENVITQVGPDMIQLHGKETPDRVAEIRANYGIPVMKAMPIGSQSDLDAALAYRDAADMLLFDAKPPENVVSALPGGNGIAFDWALLKDAGLDMPWMLSGGLTPENVAEAIAIAKPPAIDVSSGIEDRPGHKDPDRMRAFVAAVRAAGRDKHTKDKDKRDTRS